MYPESRSDNVWNVPLGTVMFEVITTLFAVTVPPIFAFPPKMTKLPNCWSELRGTVFSPNLLAGIFPSSAEGFIDVNPKPFPENVPPVNTPASIIEPVAFENDKLDTKSVLYSVTPANCNEDTLSKSTVRTRDVIELARIVFAIILLSEFCSHRLPVLAKLES